MTDSAAIRYILLGDKDVQVHPEVVRPLVEKLPSGTVVVLEKDFDALLAQVEALSHYECENHAQGSKPHCPGCCAEQLAEAQAQVEALEQVIDRWLIADKCGSDGLGLYLEATHAAKVLIGWDKTQRQSQHTRKTIEQLERDLAALREALATRTGCWHGEKGHPCMLDKVAQLEQQLAEAQARVKPP